MRMILKSCPECQQVLSFQASFCQQCGYVIKSEHMLGRQNIWKMIIGIAVILVVFLLIYQLGGMVMHALNDFVGKAIPCCR